MAARAARSVVSWWMASEWGFVIFVLWMMIDGYSIGWRVF